MFWVCCGKNTRTLPRKDNIPQEQPKQQKPESKKTQPVRVRKKKEDPKPVRHPPPPPPPPAHESKSPKAKRHPTPPKPVLVETPPPVRTPPPVETPPPVHRFKDQDPPDSTKDQTTVYPEPRRSISYQIAPIASERLITESPSIVKPPQVIIAPTPPVKSNDKKPVTVNKEIQTIEYETPPVALDEICLPSYVEPDQTPPTPPVAKAVLQRPPQPMQPVICESRPYIEEQLRPIYPYDQPMMELYRPPLFDIAINRPVTINDNRPDPHSSFQPMQSALCEAGLCIAEQQKPEPIYHYNPPTIKFQPSPLHNTAIIPPSPCIYHTTTFTPVPQQSVPPTFQTPEPNRQQPTQLTCIHHSPYCMGSRYPVQVRLQQATQSVTTQTIPYQKHGQSHSQTSCEYSQVVCQRFKQHHPNYFQPCTSPLHKRKESDYYQIRPKRREY
ncbi:uncharacterized protein LOC106871315 isoform X2 [Octopus bimaculoides]|uniref:uncharacterized protein LOC106871315 isoform X2 n=1 Tax=Octopus bimaculoides TaxID=37653 RepID=UPI00071E6395|nr:uncharacterized protein LOC106871315 isoform X2 [Octopus bimaculoides]|eukprot:XP_014773185.1 PREDICTED: extensin-1-like isoform X1 [Octopus bimaculoides]